MAVTAPMPVLRFEDVRFQYPGAASPALDGVTLEAAAGEGIALFGPNGAGKTTLLRLAMGLEKGATGNAQVGDLARDALPEVRARVAGYLFQQPEAQLFERTVARDVAFGPGCLGWSESEVADATRRALEEVGLGHVAEEHPYNLSAPHRRLVALAAVLAADPPLLLLDEPTAGLDRGSRAVVRDAILRRRASGSAVLAVTHDGEFALEALDRGMILERGRVTSAAAVTELLGRQGAPAVPATALLARELGLPVAVPRFGSIVSALVASLPHPRAGH